jgi:hypothetical protein
VGHGWHADGHLLHAHRLLLLLSHIHRMLPLMLLLLLPWYCCLAAAGCCHGAVAAACCWVDQGCDAGGPHAGHSRGRRCDAAGQGRALLLL